MTRLDKCEDIKVSVICCTYNHEKYIRQCLEGFVSQMTDFRFEVFVHDDASTDNTASILKEFAEKYPDIIKPIYETENQYSKHIGIVQNIILPRVSGKYIAFCEGDDFWNSPYKLQKQYDALEANPDCYICLHKVKVVNEDGSDSGFNFPRCEIPSGKMSSDEYFERREKAVYYQTSSYFIVAGKYIGYKKDPPKFSVICPVGDEAMLMYFSYIGNVYYINEEMSNYRYQSIGSWSSKMHCQKSKEYYERQIKHRGRFLDFLYEFDRFSKHKYKSIILNDCVERRLYLQSIKREGLWFYVNNGFLKDLVEMYTLRDIYKITKSYRYTARLFMEGKCPKLLSLYKKMRLIHLI